MTLTHIKYVDERFDNVLTEHSIYLIRKNEDFGLRMGFYISDKKLTLDNLDKAVSYIEVLVAHGAKKSATISSLITGENWRGNGFGSFLIGMLVTILDGIQMFDLDDMSDNVWLDNNIYMKMGFRYIERYGEPEMTGRRDMIMKSFGQFKKGIMNKYFKF